MNASSALGVWSWKSVAAWRFHGQAFSARDFYSQSFLFSLCNSVAFSSKLSYFLNVPTFLCIFSMTCKCLFYFAIIFLRLVRYHSHPGSQSDAYTRVTPVVKASWKSSFPGKYASDSYSRFSLKFSKRRYTTHLHGEVVRSDAEQPIKVRAGDAAARPVSVQQLVEPQLHDLIVLALESVHAAGKSVVACTRVT